MADYYADNFVQTTTTPRGLVTGGEYGGRERVYYDQINTTTGMVAADRIFVGKLMPGERFLGGEIVFGAHGASRTLQLGDSGDDDRYWAAASVQNAGNAELRAATGFGYRNSTNGPIDLFLTVAGGALAALAPGIQITYRVSRD